MDQREFARYHGWCDRNGIRVYPIPTKIAGEYHIAVERNGKASIGQKFFYNKPVRDQQCVWKQIGILLKMIYDKESQQPQVLPASENKEAV